MHLPKGSAFFTTAGFRASGVLLAALLLTSSGYTDEVKFKLLSSGASAKLGGYIPQRLTLSETPPPTVKKLPDGLSAPLFGEIKFGPKESPSLILVVVDEPDGAPARLFVDSNGNRDLTDDQPSQWDSRPAKGRDGIELKSYNGGANVMVLSNGETNEFHLAMYRFDKNDPQRKELKNVLLYYRDYAATGELVLSGKSYPAMLADNFATGDFRGKAGGEVSGVQLLIDLNGDGKFARTAETFDSHKPFNVAGTTYELADVNSSGTSFKVVKSSREVSEIAPPPNLSVGEKVVAFEARTTDGKAVKFPSSYAGKLVLLDFWATWCGPCIAELPNLTNAYNNFHAKGFEVLGISLDREKAEQKLADFTKQKNMPWPQIYDGKWWKSEIGQLYGIDSIPRAFLVEGATGKILATGADLRGAALSKTIEKALTEKMPPR